MNTIFSRNSFQLRFFVTFEGENSVPVYLTDIRTFFEEKFEREECRLISNRSEFSLSPASCIASQSTFTYMCTTQVMAQTLDRKYVKAIVYLKGTIVYQSYV